MKKLCDSCGKNPANEPDTCPYAKEFNYDEFGLCNCCDECRQECCYRIYKC